MSNLVTIHKHGEPKLTILADHLEEHKKLGWQECEPDAEEFDYANATIKEMKAFLDACGIKYEASAKADELRELCKAELVKE